MKNRINIRMSLAVATAMLLASACKSETEIHAIPDNLNPMTMTPALFTDVPEGLIEELGVEDGIPSSLCAYLVKKDGQEMLFDSGNGAENSQLIPALEALGVMPEDIDYVFITHTHGDHIGGMVNYGKAVFTNATVFINKDEYEGTGFAESDMAKAYGEKMVQFTEETVLPCEVKAIKAYAKKNMINTCVPLAFPPSAIKAVITGPKYQKNFNELEMALEVLGYNVSDISILESTSGYR